MAKELIYKIDIKGLQDDIKNIGKLEAETKALTKSQNELKKQAAKLVEQNRQGGKVYKSLTTEISKNAVKLDNLKNEKKVLNNTIKTSNALHRTEANTLNKVSAELSEARAKIKGLVIGSAEFKKVAARIKTLETKQRNYNQEIGRGRTFVGEYAKGFQSAFLKVGAAVTGVVMAFRGVSRAIGSSLDAYNEQVTAEKQLLQAFNGNIAAQQEIIKFAQERQKVTTVGDEVTIKSARQFIAAGITQEDQLKKILKATQDLAAFEGISMEKATKKVTQAIATGSTTLEKYGVELSTTNSVSENLDITLQGLNKTLEGQAEILAEEGTGKLKQFSNAWGDLKETAGGTINDLLTSIPNLTSDLTDLTDTMNSETLPAWQKFALLTAPQLTGIAKQTIDLEQKVKDYAKTVVQQGKNTEATWAAIQTAMGEEMANLFLEQVKIQEDGLVKSAELQAEADEQAKERAAELAAEEQKELEKRLEAEKEKRIQNEIATLEKIDEIKKENNIINGELEFEDNETLNNEKFRQNERYEAEDLKNTKYFTDLRIEQANRENAARQAKYAALTDMLGAFNEYAKESGSEGIELQKAIAIAQIAINTASAISNGINATKNAVTPVDFAISIATNIALVLAQIAKAKNILSGVETKFATGGVVEGQGSYNSDNVPAWLSPGEGVINARSMDSNEVMSLTGTPKQIASAINSHKGYGVAFAEGGIVPDAANLGVNYQALANSIASGLNDMQVNVLESDITRTQRTVSVVETNFSI